MAGRGGGSEGVVSEYVSSEREREKRECLLTWFEAAEENAAANWKEPHAWNASGKRCNFAEHVSVRACQAGKRLRICVRSRAKVWTNDVDNALACRHLCSRHRVALPTAVCVRLGVAWLCYRGGNGVRELRRIAQPDPTIDGLGRGARFAWWVLTRDVRETGWINKRGPGLRSSHNVDELAVLEATAQNRVADDLDLFQKLRRFDGCRGAKRSGGTKRKKLQLEAKISECVAYDSSCDAGAKRGAHCGTGVGRMA